MNKTKYDLEERTGKFGEEIILFCASLRINPINKVLISQLVRSGTSIGANYMEANSASSKKDFKNKIHICKKEAQETLHWLKMMKRAETSKSEKINLLEQECKEFILIFGKIISSLRNKN